MYHITCWSICKVSKCLEHDIVGDMRGFGASAEAPVRVGRALYRNCSVLQPLRTATVPYRNLNWIPYRNQSVPLAEYLLYIIYHIYHIYILLYILLLYIYIYMYIYIYIYIYIDKWDHIDKFITCIYNVYIYICIVENMYSSKEETYQYV